MNEKIKELMEEIATGVAGMMDTQPINLAGKENPSKYEKQGKKREKKAQLNYKYMKIRSKKGKVMESLNEAVEILEFLLGEMSSEEVSEVLETRISEELEEELSERIQEIIEGRLYDENEKRPTKEAGKLASKYKAVQKAVRRNADKNMKRADREEKEAKREEAGLEGQLEIADRKTDELRSKMYNASDILDATGAKHGINHDATRQAEDNFYKALKKKESAAKKASKIRDQKEDARKRKWAASDKHYDNYKKSREAGNKVNALDGVEYRSRLSDK